MALPSQTERHTEIGRSYVYSQRTATASGTRTALLVAVALVVIGAGVWAAVSIINRRSTTGSLGPDVKAPGAAAGATKAPRLLGASDAGAAVRPSDSARVAPSGTSDTSTTSGGAQSRPVPTYLPPRVDTPAGAPSTSGSSTPMPAPVTTPLPDTSGRPGAVDVTRKDLAPAAPVNSNPPPSPPIGTTVTPAGQPEGDSEGGAATPGSSRPAPGTLTPTGSTSEVAQLIQAGEQRAASGDLVQARVLLSKALRNPNAVRDDQERVRQRLTTINATLLFSPKITPGDPMVEEYSVKSGDTLTKIARTRELVIDWRLLERINGVNSSSLRIGQKLKLVRGPFHAVVHKGDFRLDLFQGSPDDPETWIYIRSFKVGLGTGNSTPVGNFVVKPRSKMVNPPWTNPQTGQKFAANDPKNPIGKYWLGMQGIGDSKAYTGYGLHGTIDPESIGKQMSMGCVRLGDEDIKLLYEMLTEQISVVKVVP